MPSFQHVASEQEKSRENHAWTFLCSQLTGQNESCALPAAKWLGNMGIRRAIWWHWFLCRNHAPLLYWHTAMQTFSLFLKHTTCFPTFGPLHQLLSLPRRPYARSHMVGSNATSLERPFLTAQSSQPISHASLFQFSVEIGLIMPCWGSSLSY